MKKKHLLVKIQHMIIDNAIAKSIMDSIMITIYLTLC